MRFVLLAAVCFVCAFHGISARAQVVINEIHYDPDIRTELIEFVELHNAGFLDIDISGWSLSDAVEYTFPASTTLPAGGFLVVAQNQRGLIQKFGMASSRVLGNFEGRLSNQGEEVRLLRADGMVADEVDYQLGFPWPTVGDPIPEFRPGSSHSIQLTNPLFDNNLAGTWRSAAPTPGEANAVLADNIPPRIRQVEHSPQQPASGTPVRFTAKLSDPDGVGAVELSYQVVEPGRYIALDDPEYETEWEQLPMRDDGMDGDAIAGDFIYTGVVPAQVQTHRHLVRYRITATDRAGNRLTVPYSDDPQPNFAYFVYDGVPPWTGAVKPGETEPVTYSSQMLSSIPVYHLISSKNEVERATWLDQLTTNDWPYMGTLVYDGEVFDHIRFRARGGVWRYAMGKNMWKFNMNRGHRFQARDNYGRPYGRKWDKINLGANIQQRDFLHRGEQGMFETVGFRLFQLAGVEASNTNFVHFRIIDESHEDGRLNAAHPPVTDSGTQYDGDFWGMYLATEQVDGRFLDEHELPEGNLYKIENFQGDLKNQNPFGVSDGSDVRNFMNAMRGASEAWWRDNVILENYYSYRSIIEAIHHYDINNGKNYYFFHNPLLDKWMHVPWDLDLTWANNMFGGGDDQFKQNGILRRDAIDLEYQNRLREIRDLLYNLDQTGQLIDEMASFVYDPDGESFVDADRAMWDYHWVMGNRAGFAGYRNQLGQNKSGQGEFYQIAPSEDFAGMLKIMKDYVVSRGEWIDQRILRNDQDVPETPQIQVVNGGFQADQLTFEASPFSDPNGDDTFAAMQWRMAEVEPFAGEPRTTSDIRDFDNVQEPLKYEIHAVWESEARQTFQPRLTIPARVVTPGRTYRVRVKMRDTEGHWSHWSEPIQFTAEAAESAVLTRENLRLTEIMYNPVGGSAFEYLELHNTHASEALTLDGMAFTNGVEFVFPRETQIAPQGYMLIPPAGSESEIAQFRQFWNLEDSTPITGPYQGNLDNGGERLTLRTAVNGDPLLDLVYDDGRGWPLSPDGAGHSLVPTDEGMVGQQAGALDFGGNWRASAFIGGSPGRADSEPIPGLVINELAANPLNGNDWIELYNPTAQSIHLGGWFLSDDEDNLSQWAIPPMDVPPGGFVSFDQRTGFDAGGRGFGLSRSGEELYLAYLPGASNGDRVADAVAFKAQSEEETWGRSVDGDRFWAALRPSRQQKNPPPASGLVISEVMYHPPNDDSEGALGEFIELYNASNQAVRLWTPLGPWRLGDGVDFVVPNNLMLQAQERLVVVSFDPLNTENRRAFFSLYPKANANTRLFGPFSGRLSNRGERVALEKLLDVDPDDGSLAWGIVEEVIYFDRAPWTAQADGTGLSLHRTTVTQAGSDPRVWLADTPTPGAIHPEPTSVNGWMLY